MKDIQIIKKNESTVFLQIANPIIEKEIKRYFAVKSANYRFSPLFKQGIWNGDIQFMNAENEISIGLIEKVFEFAKIGRYGVECCFDRFNNINKNEFIEFVNYLNLPFPVRDYQLDAAYQACCKKHLNIHISTAGGKSLVIYIICRFLEYQKKKTLIIVPNLNLIEQMYSDFKNYGWNVSDKCYRLYSGKEKFFDRAVTISAWQTIYTDKNKVNGNSIFSLFDCLIIDEAHGAKGTSIKGIATKCSNAQYRFGFSGTYPDSSTADWFSIVGATGPIQTFATYKSLQENEQISQLKIYSIILQYDKQFKLDLYKQAHSDYNTQNDLIYGNPKRNLFLLDLTQKLNENVLLLFTKKEAHGYKVRELFQEKLKDKILLYIDGDVPIQEREDIRVLLENNNNVVLLATYATLSAGWSVNNLHHIIFASSYKSQVKVLQSIGRALRLHKNKVEAKLYDISDDCSFIDKFNKIRFINFSIKHLKERYEIYSKENFSYKVVKIPIK